MRRPKPKPPNPRLGVMRVDAVHLPPIQPRKVDFQAAARRTNFMKAQPARRVAIQTNFRTNMRVKVRQYDALFDEAEAIMRRVENMIFDTELGDAVDTTVTDYSAPVEHVELPPGILKDLVLEHVHDEDSCAICLADFVEHETVGQLPCGHVFHRDCIACWICDHPSCPICRQKLA